MALLHWYIIPIAWELHFDREVLKNFVQFVNIIEVAMSHTPKSDEDIAALYNLVKSFLEEFKRLYVHNDPVKVSRCRLCIWQLIHVPMHIHGMGQSDLGLKPQLSVPLERLVTKSDPKRHPLPISPQCFMKGHASGC